MSTQRATSSLILRPYHGSDDHAALAEIRNATMMSAGAHELTTPKLLAEHLTHVVNCDPAIDLQVAEHDGRPVGYARLDWQDEFRGDRTHRIICFVVPGAPRQVFARLLEWAEQRHEAIAARTPTDRPRVLEIFTIGDAPAAAVELSRRGYRQARIAYEMVRPTLDDLPGTALPEGIETRPVRAEQLRAIWAAEVEAFSGHWGASESDGGEQGWHEFRTHSLNDFSLWQVAWRGDDVVGMVRPFINPAEIERLGVRRGWCENISVRAPWRGRGIARALIGAALLALRERGMTEAALGVDAANETGALALYQSVGFREVSRETEWRRPLRTSPA